MWSFIFRIFLGLLVFNSILISQKNTQGFSITKAIQELNQSKKHNASFSIIDHQISTPKLDKLKEENRLFFKELNQTIEDNRTLAEKMIELAHSKIGSPYVYANEGPDSFDCSGFVYYLFKEHNISVARTSQGQSEEANLSYRLNREEIQRGDKLFFDTSKKGHVNHSGIYLGEGKFIHASSGKAKGVTISDLDAWYKDKFLWGIHPLQNMSDQKPSKSP